jgi:hypothetical protein
LFLELACFLLSRAEGAGANASMPALLREAQPYLRHIVMLRDLVDGYYPACHYYRRGMAQATAPAVVIFDWM